MNDGLSLSSLLCPSSRRPATKHNDEKIVAVKKMAPWWEEVKLSDAQEQPGKLAVRKGPCQLQRNWKVSATLHVWRQIDNPSPLKAIYVVYF